MCIVCEANRSDRLVNKEVGDNSSAGVGSSGESSRVVPRPTDLVKPGTLLNVHRRRL